MILFNLYYRSKIPWLYHIDTSLYLKIHNVVRTISHKLLHIFSLPYTPFPPTQLMYAMGSVLLRSEKNLLKRRKHKIPTLRTCCIRETYATYVNLRTFCTPLQFVKYTITIFRFDHCWDTYIFIPPESIFCTNVSLLIPRPRTNLETYYQILL